jgi:hypothetical protein
VYTVTPTAIVMTGVRPGALYTYECSITDINGYQTTKWVVDSKGDIVQGLPMLSACGSNPGEPKDDKGGTFRTGNDATGCVLTFSVAHPGAACVVAPVDGTNWVTPGTWNPVGEDGIAVDLASDATISNSTWTISGSGMTGATTWAPGTYLDTRHDWQPGEDKAATPAAHEIKPQYFNGHAWINYDGSRP